MCQQGWFRSFPDILLLTITSCFLVILLVSTNTVTSLSPSGIVSSVSKVAYFHIWKMLNINERWAPALN